MSNPGNQSRFFSLSCRTTGKDACCWAAVDVSLIEAVGLGRRSLRCIQSLAGDRHRYKKSKHETSREQSEREMLEAKCRPTLGQKTIKNQVFPA